MNTEMPNGQALMADSAYVRLVQLLRDGSIASGAFVSMPGLVDLIGQPLAATREAVKRADVNGLVRVLPKRGVQVMEASSSVTRDCMDLRAILDSEGARRIVAGGVVLPLEALRALHEAIIEAAERAVTPDLPRRAILTNMHIDLDYAELAAQLPEGVEPAYDGLRFEHELSGDFS